MKIASLVDELLWRLSPRARAHYLRNVTVAKMTRPTPELPPPMQKAIMLKTKVICMYLYLYLAQLKPFKTPTFLASCLLLLQAALPELDRLLLCLGVSAVLNSLLLHFAVLNRLLLHATGKESD